MRNENRLRADCARCCGLCCVAPAFDADQGFGFDKPAHTACRNLDRNHRCTIHDELRVRGFPACATFDCYGAGQWVTQNLFGGKSWQTSPQIAASMFALYARYRSLHELLALLHVAIGQLPLGSAGALQRCQRDIEAICENRTSPTEAISLSALRKRVHGLLREHFGADPASRAVQP
jgi:hypothetical protein